MLTPKSGAQQSSGGLPHLDRSLRIARDTERDATEQRGSSLA